MVISGYVLAINSCFKNAVILTSDSADAILYECIQLLIVVV